MELLFPQLLGIGYYVPTAKKIRVKKWKQMEACITEHSLAQFSHSICPDCRKELSSEQYSELE
jgi:hypothetical protein